MKAFVSAKNPRSEHLGGSRFAGKKTSIKILIPLFVLAMFFPAPQAFVNAAARSAQTNAATSVPSAKILVEVIQPIVSTQLLVSQSAVQTSEVARCQAAASSGVIQNVGLLNLNQPAGCFALQDAAMPNYSPIHLAVITPAAPAVKVTVIPPQTKISSLDFLPGLPGQSMPLLPLTFFALGLIYALEDKKLKFKQLALKAPSLNFAPESYRLQVLRC